MVSTQHGKTYVHFMKHRHISWIDPDFNLARQQLPVHVCIYMCVCVNTIDDILKLVS